MGMFDYVQVSGPEFVCSEGHDLSAAEFQTKDFECVLGWIGVSAKGIETISTRTPYGDPLGSVRRPMLGRYFVYTTCPSCTVFVQGRTGNLIECDCTFEIEVVDDVVRSIKRVSGDHADFLKNEPTKPWMTSAGCFGPMSRDEAEIKRREISAQNVRERNARVSKMHEDKKP